MPQPASIADFKARFDRDFVFDTTTDAVRDVDITDALNDASSTFNDGLWASGTEIITAFLFLAAHNLVLNLQAAGGLFAVNLGRGVKSKGSGPISAKSVGSVSVNYALPESIVNDPQLSPYLRTEYGLRYLQMLTPRLVGNVVVVLGENDTGAP